MHDRKERFIRFAEDEPTLQLFMQPWWLDAVVGPQSWDVSIVEQDGKVIAALPYVTRRF
ncbi:MAG: methicillin resistance protein, partial [Actinomycetales bacterium]|nr:methicillin resistance protein [Actinomycetales bacterium]